MGGYRSGHNGADLKSVVSASTRRVGSNPTPPASKDTNSNLIKTVIVKWLRQMFRVHCIIGSIPIFCIK